MQRYIISANAVIEAFDEGGLVLVFPEWRLLELNSTAVEIIGLLKKRRTVDQIAEALFKRMEPSSRPTIRQVRRDIDELLTDLCKAGIVESISEPKPRAR